MPRRWRRSDDGRRGRAVKIFRNLVVFFTLKCVSAPCESETLRSSFSSLWEDSAIVLQAALEALSG